MARNPNRPLSPHLQIWRWGPAMALSILHRATGIGLAVAGGGLLVCWLTAIAGGTQRYSAYVDMILANEGAALHVGKFNLIPFIILFGLTWAFFQHLGSGLRHFVLDIGAGYEVNTNRLWSIIVMIASVVATIALWAYILAR